jgi:nucleoside-diphosphate-sugar epimerase
MDRIPASERTRERLKPLMEGDGEKADLRSELVRLAARLIVEEGLEGEAADALGREYYVRGAAPGAGYRNGYRTGRLKTAEGLIDTPPYMGYGRSKQAMEEWLRTGASNNNFPQITIIRAPWFYGPEQPARQTRFFSMIKAGHFPIVGDGRNRRSMGYVDSLAYGILLTAQASQAAGKIYWLADERPYPMKEIVDTVREVLRDDFGMTVKPKTIQVPGIISDLARLGDRMLQGVGLYNQELHVLSEMNLTIACTIARAKQELGYKPLVDLREGMRRSIKWCLDKGIEI